MKKYMVMLVVILTSYSIIAFSKEEIVYGYDKPKNEIYAFKGSQKGVLKFEEKYTGNPSYFFDFFSGAPAIIVDGRSLHDITVYATLNYVNNEFNINCLYYNIKSKRNGVLVKEGVCGLNISTQENYLDYIDNKVNQVENAMDSPDTSLILNGRVKYLAIIVFNSKSKLLYKLYNNKKAMLNDDYSILSIANDGGCKVFSNNPWVIYNAQDAQQAEVMSEKIINGKIEINKAYPKKINGNECLLYPAVSVMTSKAFFYDLSLNVKKSYLIKDDKINLLSVGADDKWCKVRYINNKNTAIDNNMLCSDLIF